MHPLAAYALCALAGLLTGASVALTVRRSLRQRVEALEARVDELLRRAGG